MKVVREGISRTYFDFCHRKNGRFADLILYFLRLDSYAECKVLVSETVVNLGDGEGVQVSYSSPKANFGNIKKAL